MIPVWILLAPLAFVVADRLFAPKATSRTTGHEGRKSNLRVETRSVCATAHAAPPLRSPQGQETHRGCPDQVRQRTDQ